MSKNQKSHEEIEEKVRIVGLVTPSVKGELFKQSIVTGEDVQDIVGDILTNEFTKKKSKKS